MNRRSAGARLGLRPEDAQLRMLAEAFEIVTPPVDLPPDHEGIIRWG